MFVRITDLAYEISVIKAGGGHTNHQRTFFASFVITTNTYYPPLYSSLQEAGHKHPSNAATGVEPFHWAIPDRVIRLTERGRQKGAALYIRQINKFKFLGEEKIEQNEFKLLRLQTSSTAATLCQPCQKRDATEILTEILFRVPIRSPISCAAHVIPSHHLLLPATSFF